MQAAYLSPAREHQIAELTAQIPSCRPLNRDQSLFEAPLRLDSGRNTALRISLPPSFPQGRPGLSVTHPVSHPWVDSAGRLSFPSLEQWAPGHSRLAAVVADAHAALTGHPPIPPPLSAGPLAAGSPGQEARSAMQQAQQQQQQQQQAARPSPTSRLPAVPGHFSELQKLSEAELAALVLDEEAYRGLVQRIAQQGQVFQVQRQLEGRNTDLARANLDKEGELGEIRNQIAIIRSSEYALAKEAFDTQLRRQERVLSKIKPSQLIDKLREATDAVDEESSELCATFMAGNMSVEAFVQQYVKLRTLYHERELKGQAALRML